MKYVCPGYLKYKCAYSEEYYSWDTERDSGEDYFLFRGEVCSNDPHFYQVCDKEIGGEVTNSKLLCEHYLCDIDHTSSDKKRILVSKELGSIHGDLACKNTELNKAGLEDDTDLPSGAKLHSSQICDGQCDVRFCEDEGVCNGYTYGFHCISIWNKKNRYMPPQEVCDGNQNCLHGEDEENCSVTNKTEASCKHYLTGKQVPVFNFTRCTRMDLSPYASLAFSYCDLSDLVLYQTNCSDPSLVGVTCKIDGYDSKVSNVLICSYYNLDVCDDKIERKCLRTNSCNVHKHHMCDETDDCTDKADETQGWRNRGGQGGHGPPKNLSGRAKVCFGPPKIFDHWPSQNGASGGQIASEHPEMGQIFKILACGGLLGEELFSLVILGCKAEDSDQFPLPCYIP